MYENPWLYKGEPLLEIPKGIFGFVYLITCLSSGKLYIGRKYSKSLRKPKDGGRRKSSESDWRAYYSSNEWIKEQIKSGRARNTFKREILHLCETQGKTNYFEVKEQFSRGVLENDNYLNDNINGKWYKKNVIKY